MKKYKLSSSYIDRTMNKIEYHCLSDMNETFCGPELSKFCSKPKNVYAIRLLEASGEIRTIKADNSEIPSAIFLENKGVLHSYTKAEKIKSSINGFFVGLFSGIIATVGSELLVHFILSFISK